MQPGTRSFLDWRSFAARQGVTCLVRLTGVPQNVRINDREIEACISQRHEYLVQTAQRERRTTVCYEQERVFSRG